MIHTRIHRNTPGPPVSVSFCTARTVSLTHDSALYDSAHLLSKCLCLHLHLAPYMRLGRRPQGSEDLAYSKTVESSPQDSINQSPLISFDITLSAAEVANYHTQGLHHDPFCSPCDVCAFSLSLVHRQKMNHESSCKGMMQGEMPERSCLLVAKQGYCCF